MHLGSNIILDTTTAPFATLEKRHVTRHHTRPLAEAAESLLDRLERLRDCSPVDRGAAELQSSATRQWVVDLTYRIVKCAYAGIAQIRDMAQTPELLAETGRSALDCREWWEYVQNAVFTERRARAADAQLTGDPLVVHLPAQQTTTTKTVQQGRVVCAVPINISGKLTAIFAIEAQGSAPVLPSEVMMLARAMASTAAMTFDAVALSPTRGMPETKALRVDLEEMDRAFSLVSHELKSPLTTIVGSLQLIERKVERLAHLAPNPPAMEKTRASIQELVELASQHAGIVDMLATDLVDASRIRSAKLTLRLMPCDLGQIVKESVHAQRVASPRRIIHLEVPGRGIPVSADPDRIAQVVSNFLGNAVKYSSKDTPVEVWVDILKTHARVSVRDHGPGLEKAELTRVWQRFYRVSGVPAHSATGSGLGLGLYIGREIIRGHGGTVGASSEPGQGATFWFTLPLAKTK
jgi:signal transduction histidine kinase